MCLHPTFYLFPHTESKPERVDEYGDRYEEIPQLPKWSIEGELKRLTPGKSDIPDPKASN